MRKITQLLAVVSALSMGTLPALATEDIGNGQCLQDNGVVGVWNGTTADDGGCITEVEYAFLYSPKNLVNAGVIQSFEDNDDGAVTLDFGNGAKSTTMRDPLDRLVATDRNDPSILTVREVLFGTTTIIRY